LFFLLLPEHNLKLDFKQESMAVQVRNALSKQVRKKNVNKIHSSPNKQQSMHDGEFLHTVMKMSRCSLLTSFGPGQSACTKRMANPLFS
jgi:hypothetical protein